VCYGTARRREQFLLLAAFFINKSPFGFFVGSKNVCTFAVRLSHYVGKIFIVFHTHSLMLIRFFIFIG
jgi:hypothetical protein